MSEIMYDGIPFSPQVALADSIGEADTVIKVTDVSAFPTAPNYATIGTDESGETILYAAKTSNALSGCARGVEGAAKAWPAGSTIARNFTAKDLHSLQSNIREAKQAADDASQKADDVDKSVKEYLPKSGGTMTGGIDMNGQPLSGLNAPTENGQAANKAYADTKAELPKTASGEIITLSDASDSALQKMRIYGKTTQNGTPTQENPVGLVSVGSSGSITISIDSQNLTLSTPNGLPGIPVKSGGNYIDADGQQWICNEVDFGRGVYVQRVHALTFDGSIDESWLHNSSSMYPFFEIELNPPKKRMPGMCTHFSNAIIFSTSGNIGFGLESTNNARFRPEDYATITLEAWRQRLSASPMTILYVLEVPTETTLDSQVLAAYAAMRTNAPNTTAYNDAGAHMEIGYYTPTATMLQADIVRGLNKMLPKSGGAMTGPISMGGSRITGLGNPTSSTDATRKDYVDKKVQAVTNASVPIAAWESSSDQSDVGFPYRAAVILNDVIGTINYMVPDVYFSAADAVSGNFSPVAKTYAGGVYIYAADKPTAAITIPTIRVTR